jgi:hypothetical protein
MNVRRIIFGKPTKSSGEGIADGTVLAIIVVVAAPASSNVALSGIQLMKNEGMVEQAFLLSYSRRLALIARPDPLSPSSFGLVRSRS